MAQSKSEVVHCRYPQCKMIHESTELLKDEAIRVGSRNYYHPDCYHTHKTIDEIRELFCKNINTTMTASQIKQLVSIINSMVFVKKIDVNYIKFALEYIIKNKPGALKHSGGMSHIVQDKDVESAWDIEKQRIANELSKQSNDKLNEEELDFENMESTFVYKPQKTRSFADILH